MSDIEEDFSELQAETIFNLQRANEDLANDVHKKLDTLNEKLDTIYLMHLETKKMIENIMPPSGLQKMNNDDNASVSSFASCQSVCNYDAYGCDVMVYGKGLFPVYRKNGTDKLFTMRNDGSFKPLSPAQKIQVDNYQQQQGTMNCEEL